MTYDKHYEWAKDALQKIETKKKDVIIALAGRLETSGMLVESICAEISNNLSRDGYVTDRYVREVLDKTKYKRKYENKLEDIGTSSELRQQEQELHRSNEIAVCNTGEQVSSTPAPKKQENLVPLSDLLGLQKAIFDRDKTIMDLKEKLVTSNSDIQGKSPETEAHSEFIKLKEVLEAANMEIDYLKGELGAEKIVALKGKKGENVVGQFYWGKTALRILKSKINQLEHAGISTVEIFMVSVGAVGEI